MSMNLEFYRMEGGGYPDEPNFTRKIKLDLRSGEAGQTGASQASVMIGDVNGDGRPDLLMGKGRKELRIYAGVPRPHLFVRQPQKVTVAILNDEKYTWLVDLNRDGKQDIFMHHPSTTEPHRLTMLVAR